MRCVDGVRYKDVIRANIPCSNKKIRHPNNAMYMTTKNMNTVNNSSDCLIVSAIKSAATSTFSKIVNNRNNRSTRMIRSKRRIRKNCVFALPCKNRAKYVGQIEARSMRFLNFMIKRNME